MTVTATEVARAWADVLTAEEGRAPAARLNAKRAKARRLTRYWRTQERDRAEKKRRREEAEMSTQAQVVSRCDQRKANVRGTTQKAA